MKKNLIVTILVAGALCFAGAAYATTDSASPSQKTRPEKAAKTETALQKIITKADKEIARRLESLASLTKRINDMKKIAVEDKNALIAKISAEQEKLTALKTKIDAATDLAILKEDVKSIASSYRVYLLIVPQMQVLASADRMDSIIASLKAVGVKLQTRITEAETAGKDVAALKKLLDDFNAQIADAEKQTAAAKGHVLPLVPDGGDKTIQKHNADELKIARADIKVAHEDFTAAKSDAKKILQGLKELGFSKTASVKAEGKEPKKHE